ncbi:MAG: hypothetical protein AB8I08_15055 [Sandaracinaceae bacterium]
MALPCDPFVDALPLHFDAADGPLSIAVTDGTFHISHFHGNPSPCDGPCLGELSLGLVGPASDFLPSYWLEESNPRTEIVSGAGLAVSVAYATDGSVAWRHRPLSEEPWRADGTFRPEEGRIASGVVPSFGDTLSILTRNAEESPEGFQVAEMIDVDRAGEVLRRFDLRETVLGFPVQEARLVPARLGGAWLVSIQNWDFPPTVQINRINGPGSSFRGTSCGVDEYDAAELGDETLVVAQRCGTQLEVVARTVVVEPTFVADDAAELAPAVTVLRRNLEVAVAYVRAGARAPTLVRLEWTGSALAPVETTELTPDPAIQLPITQVDLTSSSDGTIAVTWLGTQIGDPWDASEGAVQRLRACR